MLEQLRLIMEALPWTGPAILVGGGLALLTALFFPKRRSRSDRVGVALFVWCVVVALVVTLSPVKNYYFGVPTRGCNLAVWRPLNHHYWLSSGSRPPNVWLLLPAGIGGMLIDGFIRRVLAIGFLVALPPGIEALQKFYPELKRSCSSQDIVDNWTGLAIGLAIGLVLMVFIGFARLVRRRHDRARRAGVVSGRSAATSGASAVPATEDAADAPMPLGGGSAGRYADFGDFDDSPSSTRWWVQDDEPTAPVRSEERYAEWHHPRAQQDQTTEQTQQAPQPARGRWPDERHDEDATREAPARPMRRRERRDAPEQSVDSTQVLPTYTREGDDDGDTTQIIPRA